jgi:hypothetical protein
MHRTIPEFWDCIAKLPPEINAAARNAFERLRDNPRHPSLQLKRVGKVWSARVGLNYRALALPVDDGFIWFWIGPHEEYEEKLRHFNG